MKFTVKTHPKGSILQIDTGLETPTEESALYHLAESGLFSRIECEIGSIPVVLEGKAMTDFLEKHRAALAREYIRERISAEIAKYGDKLKLPWIQFLRCVDEEPL